MNKKLIKNLLTGLSFAFSSFTLNLHAATTITSDLCVQIDSAVEIGIHASPGVEAHVEGGAGWEVAFVGKATGEVAVGVAAEVGVANAVDISVDFCVNAEDLKTMYENDLLTNQQRDAVELYLGQNAVSNDQAEEARSGLLSAAYVNGFQVKRTEAVLRPIATAHDIMVSTITGELSLIDMMDETIYAVEGVADALPMDPTLARFLTKFGEDMGRKMGDVQKGMEKVCESVVGDGTPIGSVCENITNIEKGADNLQDNIRTVVNFGGQVAGQVKQVEKVISGVSQAMEKLDGTMGKTIGQLDTVSNTVGSTTREVIALTTDTQRAVGAMTAGIDGAVGATTSSIGAIKDVVITPLEAAAKVSKSTIDAILSVLKQINTQLQNMSNAMNAEVA